jgi:hypothetical protein
MRAMAATRSKALAGTMMTSGTSLTVHASANAAAVLPADATTRVRLSSGAMPGEDRVGLEFLEGRGAQGGAALGPPAVETDPELFETEPLGEARALVDGGLRGGRDLAAARKPSRIAPDRGLGGDDEGLLVVLGAKQGSGMVVRAI